MGIVRGIDHVAMTVPDVEEATRFLREAFGARVLYDGQTPSSPAVAGSHAERVFGMPPGGSWDWRRMLAVGDSVLELFHYRVEGQSPAGETYDLGIQHIALLVDDLDEAAARFERAGGTLYAAHDAPDGRVGPGTAWVYGRSPWGAIFELVTFPAR